MKILKNGKPYRKRKCYDCGAVYVYHIIKDLHLDCLHCPVCNELDYPSIFDKKISEEEYKKIGDELNSWMPEYKEKEQKIHPNLLEFKDIIDFHSKVSKDKK